MLLSKISFTTLNLSNSATLQLYELYAISGLTDAPGSLLHTYSWQMVVIHSHRTFYLWVITYTFPGLSSFSLIQVIPLRCLWSTQHTEISRIDLDMRIDFTGICSSIKSWLLRESFGRLQQSSLFSPFYTRKLHYELAQLGRNFLSKPPYASIMLTLYQTHHLDTLVNNAQTTIQGCRYHWGVSSFKYNCPSGSAFIRKSHHCHHHL